MQAAATLPRCRACTRLNPPGARFCYHDGVALAGFGDAAPIAVGARPFLTPFVFPSGRSCGTFDELMLACEQDWDSARDMLKQGFFEGFLGALGRADLAVAARQAGKELDPDRGLDLLLSRLPGRREPTVLAVQPAQVSLGQMAVGLDRRFALRLENRGMGLLTGSVAADVPWLAIGDAPGAPKKLFQCRHEVELPVQVHGKALRAGPKQLVGQLLIESSGGAFAVPVQVEVPPRLFREGVLAGDGK